MKIRPKPLFVSKKGRDEFWIAVRNKAKEYIKNETHIH